jgi:hypothetical protein
VEKKKIEKDKFEFSPKDPRRTFLSLVSRTYPHGHEEEVLEFLPELNKDSIGNYYKIIGSSPTTMFTSHLDTADHRQNDVVLYSDRESGSEIISTDGKTILGADDKAGVTVMLYMMEKGVPGLYYFFIGEERGGIGSRQLSEIFGELDYLKEIKRCVSFDRRDCHSIITRQLSKECCSNEFAEALCSEYNKSGFSMRPDPTGIFTDSAMLMGKIPECTNVSVGYYKEHTPGEHQNMDHLIKLCEASVEVDWDSLPTVREIVSTEISAKAKMLVKELNKMPIFSGLEDGMLYFDIEGLSAMEVVSSIDEIQSVLGKHGVGQVASMDNGYIIIELGI